MKNKQPKFTEEELRAIKQDAESKKAILDDTIRHSPTINQPTKEGLIDQLRVREGIIKKVEK